MAARCVSPVVCGYWPVNIEAKEAPVFGHCAMAPSKVTPPAAIRASSGEVCRG
jgi:hypothetical protein